jgi:putative ABC transport system permease protein
MGYVRRTIVRARMRSLLTVLGTALALGLFAFVWTLSRGVARLSESADQPVLVVFQSSRFCPLTSDLPVRYAQEIAEMEGVAQVLPTLLFINSCRANLDLVTLHGVPTDGLRDIHKFDFLDGDMERWQREDRGALIGKRLADRRGLSVGDRVQLSNVDVRVDAIIESDSAGIDNIAFVRLAQLQNARKKRGMATQLMVRLEDGANPNKIAQAIDARYANEKQATDTKTMQAFVQGAVGEIIEVVDFAKLLGYLAVAVVLLILSNTVSISAQTRAAELGVMETVGASRGLLMMLVLLESLLLSVLGGVLGIGAVAVWLGASPLTMGVEGWGIDVTADQTLLVAGAVVTLLVGLVAAIGPALGVARRSLAMAVRPE